VTAFGVWEKPSRVLLNGQPTDQWWFDPDSQSVSILSSYSRSGQVLKIMY
jgi:hypothetical protein